MNKIFIVGNLTRDPERTSHDSGKVSCRFTVAVNRMYDHEKADYFKVITWGQKAENCYRYLLQGKKVAVEGAHEMHKYVDKDGIERIDWEIKAESVEFLSPASNAEIR